jgi:Flp pilus assembly protein TadD
MERRWLCGLAPLALCLAVAGCANNPLDVLTGGTVALLAPAPAPAQAEPVKTVPGAQSDELPREQLIEAALAVARKLDAAGDDPGALEQYEKVAELDPANLLAARRLCALYDRRGDFRKAEEQYLKVEKARPNDADLYNDWGYSYFLRTGKDNWGKAEAKLRHALQLNPKHVLAHNNLGLVLGHQGRYDEALREFRAAGLNEAEAHCNLAFVYWGQYKLADAQRECRTARDLDPACTKAKEMLVQLELPPRRPDPKAAPGHATPDGLPRASKLTAADWARERALARMAVGEAAAAEDFGAPPGAAPAPVPPPSSGPRVFRTSNGTVWKEVTPKTPRAPETGDGAPGTVTYGE